MSFKTISVAALLAAVAQAGSLHIKNDCASDIYIFQRQGAGATSDKMTLQPGGMMSDPYKGDAVNYLVHSKDTDDPCHGEPCTQLEYSSNSQLFYDVSNIDGAPFSDMGMALKLSGPGSDKCDPLVCEASAGKCKAAYWLPDDRATHACDVKADMHVSFCTKDPEKAKNDSEGSYDTTNVQQEVKQAAPAPQPTTFIVQPSPSPAPAPAPVQQEQPAPQQQGSSDDQGSPMAVRVGPNGGLTLHEVQGGGPQRRHVHDHAHVHAHNYQA